MDVLERWTFPLVPENNWVEKEDSSYAWSRGQVYREE